MARSFSGTAQYLNRSTTDAGAAHLTLSAWINPTAVSGVQGIISHDDSGGAGTRHFQFRLNGASGELIVFVADVAHTASVAGFTTGSWQHICGTYDGETVSIYRNAGTPGTNTTPSGNAGGTAQTSIGARWNGVSFVELFSGAIAECAYWNAACTADEVTALHQKHSPLMIRPTALLSYWPLLGRSTNEEDWLGNRLMTTTGATVSEHMPIFWPRQRAMVAIAAAAGGGTFTRITGSRFALAGPGGLAA